nr:hypothetical protein [Gammaproteobacteria bacterium]
RRARRHYRIVRAQHPEHLGARVGLARTALDLRRYPAAAARVAALQRRFPEERAVRDLAEDWRVHGLRELIVTSAYAERSGAQIGSRELALDGRLYSRPLAHHYRAFLHGRLARADFEAERAYFRRTGAGVELRRRDLRAELELVRDSWEGTEETGLTGLAEWRLDDRWTLSAAAETESRHVPLQARLAGVAGVSIDATAGYRASEARAARLRLRAIYMDDGNERAAATLTGRARVITRPAYRAELRGTLYASRNSARGVPYFNPERDLAVELTWRNAWPVSRRHERAFTHALDLTAGRYWQKGFGAQATGAVRYEHRWRLGRRLALSYGVTRARQVFDGEREHATSMDLTLRWRF